MKFRPMPLVRLHEPFDHPDWLFELKHDGFRALAHVVGHQCELVSRRGIVFKRFPQLSVEIAHSARTSDAVIDGEIVCLDDDGRSNFHKLLFHREWPYFYAFDLLALNGADFRDLPLSNGSAGSARLCPASSLVSCTPITSMDVAGSSSRPSVKETWKASSGNGGRGPIRETGRRRPG